jgi:flagellar basal body-associated protein FliL
MKKLLLILVLLLLLGAGAGGAWWFYLRKPDNAAPPPPSPTLSKIDIEPLSISVIKNNHVERVFFIKLTLIFDSPEKQAKVSKILPRLIDGFNVELHQLLARKLMEESGYNTDLIITRLQEVADREMGPGTVAKVSIAGIDRQEFK